ncbi:response regulator transcription factor [Kitasatospora sp. NPDC093806]|uniref:response regulator transcription factor n=1 Tax=Kitasatospora sp. NPDC093806 TaxID=3155075 RepID=UPI00342D30CA
MDQVASRTLRILLVDDHELFRAGLRQLLDRIDSLTVVGEASSGADVLSAVERLAPDVVLMDIGMPGTDGIEATRTLLARHPRVAVVMLTADDQDDSIVAAVRAGARGYLVKGAGLDDVRRAITAVSQGGALFGPEAAVQLLAQVRRPAPEREPFPDLTPRELAVLTMLADGRNNASIANEFGLSMKTVRNYLSRIFGKLQVTDRAEAAVRARRAGLGT